MNPKTKEFREQVANQFIKALEENEYNWKKGWKAAPTIPQNAVSGAKYNGINRFTLTMLCMEKGYTDPRFATFKQISDKGWHLNKGSKGHKVEYWMPYDSTKKKALSWGDFRKLPEEEKAQMSLTARYFTVFNAADIEGIPELKVETHDIEIDKIIPTICKNMEIEIINDGKDSAFYRPSEDKIHLPKKEYFESDYDYNSVALHELSHATGAPHRLNRNIKGYFASDSYAFEELVAEISSTFMSSNLASTMSDYQMESHKAYIQSWISELKEKPETLIQAIKEASKAADYLEFQAELISEKELRNRHSQIVEVNANDTNLMVTKEEIKKAGFKPTATLLRSMNNVNEAFNRKISLKELAQMAKSGEHFEHQNLIDSVVKECQKQELSKIKERTI